MNKIISLGSLNIDQVFRLPHALRVGETMTSLAFTTGSGGKGANQSIAAARAGAEVWHAGKIGRDGGMLIDALHAAGVDTRLLEESDEVPSGRAVVLVNPAGNNSIVLFPGANHALDSISLDRIIAAGAPGDILMMQNETNMISEAMRRGKAAGLRLAFNFAPFDANAEYPLELVDYLFLNEIEGEGLSGESDPWRMYERLRVRFPRAETVLTLGPRGSLGWEPGGAAVEVPAPEVEVVDTTAAGDTFIGYFLFWRMSGARLNAALSEASVAASLCCTRRGAGEAIPTAAEVDAFAGR